MKKRMYILILIVFLIPRFSFSQKTGLTTDSKNKLIKDIQTKIGERYIFKDIAENCVLQLNKNLESGKYDSIKSKANFAKILTQDLQEASNDKHLELEMIEQMTKDKSSESMFLYMNRLRKSRQMTNYSFHKVEIIKGNIGYLDIRAFSPAEEAMNKASAAMEFLKDCDALIMDMRNNTGGVPSLISFISSFFFEEPTLLNTIYYRDSDRTLEFWTQKLNDINTLYDIPLYILTSHETFSAPEEFAYNLQSRKRATIVGEATGGGAHIASGFRLNESFVIYIPRGEAINPVTNENWERVGVQPDYITNYDKALEKAIELASIDAKEFRDKKEKIYENIVKELESAIKSADEEFADGYNQDVESKIINLLIEAKDADLIDESSLNTIGYEYLNKEKHLISITFFKFCVSAYPKSSNAYDSLGEAYLKFGNQELAIKNYKKSLELNPKNSNAKKVLEEINK